MIDDEAAIPIPVRWRVALAPVTTTRISPIVIDDGVVVRCGDRVACLDRDDGSPRWIHDLPARSGYGGIFVRCGEVIVTDVTRRDGPTDLVAIGPGGAQAWRLPLDGRLPDGGAVFAHGQLYVLRFPEPMREELLAIDPATGRVISRARLELGIIRVAGIADGLLGLRRTVEPGGAGSFWLAPDGSGVTPIGRGACRDLAVAAERDLFAAVYSGDDGDRGGTLEVRRTCTRELLWSRPIVGRCCALDGDELLAIVPGGQGGPGGPSQPTGVPALLDAETAAERWRGEPLAEDQLASWLAFAGSTVYLRGYGAGDLRRRSDGARLGECFNLGPPAAEGDRLWFIVEDGAVCGVVPDVTAPSRSRPP